MSLYAVRATYTEEYCVSSRSRRSDRQSAVRAVGRPQEPLVDASRVENMLAPWHPRQLLLVPRRRQADGARPTVLRRRFTARESDHLVHSAKIKRLLVALTHGRLSGHVPCALYNDKVCLGARDCHDAVAVCRSCHPRGPSSRVGRPSGRSAQRAKRGLCTSKAAPQCLHVGSVVNRAAAARPTARHDRLW